MSINKYNVPFPKVIRIEPSSLCNLKCIHCPTGTIDMPRGIMSDKTLSLILKNIQNNIHFIKVAVIYHGGEPLLNKNFSTIIKNIKSLGVPLVKANTNGMLLTEEKINDIIDSNLDVIKISLDGRTPEENNLIRQNCNFDIVIKNIKKLIQVKRKYKLDKPNILIATAQIMTQEIAKLNEEAINNDLLPEPELPIIFSDIFSEEIKNNEIDFLKTYIMEWPDMTINNELFELKTFNSPEKNFCDSVINTVTIRWNGDVVPCCYDLTSKYIIDNIHNNSLSEIWNNKKYINLRKSIDEKQFCSLCENCNSVKPKKYLILKQKLS